MAHKLEQEVAAALAGGSQISVGSEGRGTYPDDLLQGDLVVRRDIKGRKKFRVSHTRRSGGFVQVYARQVGGSGEVLTFDRSQLRLAD